MNQDEQYIRQLEPYFQGADRPLLDRLLEHASYLYKSLYRYSGEPYLTRALRLTCEKILKLNPDRDTIVASVLVSACYSPRCDLEKIEKLFGNEVKSLVEALGKINAIKSRYSSSDSRVISNMFLTLAQDIRVILIRLADRIENMETLQYKSPEKQKANAREILDVYVPIASRLGLYEHKLVLEDMAFRYVFPEEYQALKRELDDYLGETRRTMDDAARELQELMFRNGFAVKVSGRVKNLFSIYKKLKKKIRTLNEIYDVYAMRIVLDSDENVEQDSQDDIEKLYKILSVLHGRYEMLSDRFKDYVANPKANGYRSLHTALIGLNSLDRRKPTEVQIRTAAMHKFAEHGFAAHWLYKESHNLPQDDTLARALSDLRRGWKSIDRSTAELKMNLYPDRVFVLTPDNLVREMPQGATPVDFAFSVHSEIGHHCQLAKVNGNVVPLDYQLKNGDIVEIMTTPKINTKLSWLEFVKTKHARNKIKSYFRTFNKDDLLAQGKEELNELLEKMGLDKLDDHLTFLKKFKGKSISLRERQTVLEEIGAGVLTAAVVYRHATGKSPEINTDLVKPYRLQQSRRPKILPRLVSRPAGGGAARLLIGGEKNMPYRISSCCKPKLTDQIVGYITRNKGVSIHKVTCSFVANAPAERLLEARLVDAKADPALQAGKYQVSLLLEMQEGQGRLKQIIDYFNRQGITVQGYSLFKQMSDRLVRRLLIDISDEEELDMIVANLETLEGVSRVYRM
jgi:GTP pyrophosphokinase